MMILEAKELRVERNKKQFVKYKKTINQLLYITKHPCSSHIANNNLLNEVANTTA